jgi:hypothetical protein
MPGTQKKAEPMTPHFLSLNQDIVARSQKQECGLKYEILSQPEKRKELLASFDYRGLSDHHLPWEILRILPSSLEMTILAVPPTSCFGNEPLTTQ